MQFFLIFLKNRILRSRPSQLLFRTVWKWQQDDCLAMGAALAYYALFSLFPILLVVLSIFGSFLGPDSTAFNQIELFARQSLPPDAYQVVYNTLLQLHQGSSSASLVGFAVLLFTASGFFSALNRSFNKIWQVMPHPHFQGNVLSIVLNFVWQRLLAFTLVISSTLLILASLLSNLAIDALLKILENFSDRIYPISIDSVTLLPWLQQGVSLLILMLVVMVLFKVLPSTRVTWKDVWLGSLLTAILLVMLQQLVSNSVISLGSRFRSYGVVGGVMVLMLWIFLTSQIFFMGGEFTYIYAKMYGSRRDKSTPAPTRPPEIGDAAVRSTRDQPS